MNISKILRTRRLEIGITQAQLATHIGLETRGAITRLELGDRRWRFIDVVKACELLKLKIIIENIN